MSLTAEKRARLKIMASRHDRMSDFADREFGNDAAAIRAALATIDELTAERDRYRKIVEDHGEKILNRMTGD